MKNSISLLLPFITFLFSCESEHKKLDYVSFSGKIIDSKKTEMLLLSKENKNYKKIIKIDSTGYFKDSIEIKDNKNFYFFYKDYYPLYLENGYDLNISFDPNNVKTTLTFEGDGSENNNFLALVVEKTKKLMTEYKIDSIDPIETIKTKTINHKKSYETYMSSLENKNIESTLFEQTKNDYLDYLEKTKDYWINKERYKIEILTLKGKIAPDFKGLLNIENSKESLNQFKGSYVYIDVWATWCKPCVAEIPDLKKLEKQFHGKNIKFVSISVDKKEDFDKWKKFVIDKQLVGKQLFANKECKSEFAEFYKIDRIPRFIILDPKGIVVSGVAPKPSSGEEIKTLLSSLL